jgi:exosortase
MPSAPPELAVGETDVAVTSRGPLLAGAVVLLLMGWFFWDLLSRQLRYAIEQQADWGHTLIIPIISLYFVYLNRHKILAQPFRTTWIAFVPIVAGIGIYVLTSLGPVAIRHHNLRFGGAWLTLSGLVLLFCGFRAMRYLWFPLLFLLVFGQTISERLMTIVTFELQDITARGSHILLSLIPGIDVDRTGNTLYLYSNGEEMPLNIAEACSGMRMLMAFLALGVVMAYTGLQRAWQRVLLVVLAVPNAIFVNILRVVTLGLLSLLDTGFAAGDFHSFVGLVWLVPAFFIYLGLMWIIRKLVVDEDGAKGEVVRMT